MPGRLYGRSSAVIGNVRAPKGLSGNLSLEFGEITGIDPVDVNLAAGMQDQLSGSVRFRTISRHRLTLVDRLPCVVASDHPLRLQWPLATHSS